MKRTNDGLLDGIEEDLGADGLLGLVGSLLLVEGAAFLAVVLILL